MIARNERPEDETPAEKDGGFGGDPYPLGHKNELAKLEGRALKWNIKQEWREAILKRQVSTAIDPGTSPRDSARAAKFVLDADKFEEERDRPKQGTTVNIQNNGGDIQVIQDANWYGNADRLPPEAS